MMENQLANLASLSEKQQQELNRAEKELGVVLVAFDGYRQEDENGNLQQQ